MPFIIIGVAMFIVGAVMLRKAIKIMQTDTDRGFGRDDIGDLGELRTRLANVESTVRQMMHSGEVPRVDAGWVPAQDDRRVQA